MKKTAVPSSLFLPAAISSWSVDQIQQLRRLASEGLPVSEIAGELRRTVSAVRNKAGMHGISLARTMQGACDAASSGRGTVNEEEHASLGTGLPRL